MSMRIITVLLVVLVAVPGALAANGRSRGAPATCAHQSQADFSPSRRNLVVGPLVLVDGREPVSPSDVKRLGGMKYPAVVRAGHRAIVEIARAERSSTSLLYADRAHHSGRRNISDGDPVVDFRSCSARAAGSTYGRQPVTFWSGFVLASTPRCVHLRIWIDDERTPRHARIALGARC